MLSELSAQLRGAVLDHLPEDGKAVLLIFRVPLSGVRKVMVDFADDLDLTLANLVFEGYR